MRILNSATFQYGFGQFLYIAGRIARDLLLARILGPDVFGIWAGLSIYRQYTAYSDLGATNGLGRLLPKLLNEGDQVGARTVMGMAWSMAMGVTLIFSLLNVAWVTRREQSSSLAVIWGLITVIGLMFLDKYYIYLMVVFRSNRRVGEAGLWTGAQGVLELTTGILLVALFGLYGLYASLVLSSLMVISLMKVRQPLHALRGFDGPLFRQLAVASLVLMGFGLMTLAMHNIDRVAILIHAGAGAELGQYHIAALVSLGVSQLPLVILSVLSPEIFRFGKGDPHRLRRYVLLPTALAATLGVGVAAPLWWALPFILHLFLPQYIPALPIAGMLMLGELCFSITSITDNIVVALERGGWGLAIRWMSVLLGFAGSVWVLSRGYGPVEVATVMLLVHAVGGLIVAAMAVRGTHVPLGRYVLMAVGPMVYGGCVLLGVRALCGPPPITFFGTIAQLAVGVTALSPLSVIVLGYMGRGPLATQRMRHFLYWEQSPLNA